MNSPEFNNYIQYVTRNGIVKSKSVTFQDDGENTTFEVSGINEDFFIIAVFQNNLQRFGIGFENFDNVNMLGFINSNMIDISCIPSNSFLNSEQVVVMSYNNDYVDAFNGRSSSQQNPDSSNSSNDPEDLKYLKSLMKTLYPTHIFTYVPYQITYYNQFPNRETQPSIYSYNNNTCFFMSLNASNSSFDLLNKLSSHQTVGGDYFYDAFQSYMNLPILFTGIETYEGTTAIFGKGYKVISDLPLWIE